MYSKGHMDEAKKPKKNKRRPKSDSDFEMA